MTLIRQLLRFGMLALFAGSVAGCNFFVVKDEVYEVPGYGYVVHVTKIGPKTDETGRGNFEQRVKRFYFFQYEEEARHFIAVLKDDGTSSIGRRPTYYQQGSEDYAKIECAVGLKACIPPGVLNRIDDAVTPSAPTSPPPQ